MVQNRGQTIFFTDEELRELGLVMQNLVVDWQKIHADALDSARLKILTGVNLSDAIAAGVRAGLVKLNNEKEVT